ncbi:MAG: rRNA pseudouridine synthase [Acidimicrobiia bacterium]|nr:rRNA pseudouridine synthase [Acidimicrobiia bacterium]
MSAPDGEKLQKVLARAGLGSRRTCEQFIAAGRVAVNGETATVGRRVDVNEDLVTFDGSRIPVRPGLVHYLCNKPLGTVTTVVDTHGRPTVVDLVPAEPRVFPVGRLDIDTSGLLILTNDGDLTQILTHPSHGVPKTYLVEVEGLPGPDALRRLREGVDLDDGRTAPVGARVLERRDDSAALELILHEGRNRQVRRMCETVSHPVLRLVRTRIGNLADTSLAPGEWRELTDFEVRALYAAAGTTTDADAGTNAGGGDEAEG